MPSNNGPGVTAREIDLTGQAAASPVGVPAAVISPTSKGPAFVPYTVPNKSGYADVFGTSAENYRFGPLAANEWLTYQQSLTQVRVLGIGDGTQRTSSDINRGKVPSAGFVVGDRQPQPSLSGGLGANPYANATSVGGAVGPAGRTYFLAAFMSQSAGSSYISDAVGSNTGTMLRGMIMAASGVLMTLSASNVSSTVPSPDLAADFSVPGNVQGAPTGSVNLQNGLQEFVMLFNGHKGSTQYPRFITASFDMAASNYFGNVLNRDPLKLEQAGHVLYSVFDIHPTLAVVTGSGFVAAASGAGGFGLGYERVAMLVTSSLARNSGSTTVPNFENFEDRYRTASSPWVTSQKFGGSSVNLFKFWSLSDGDSSNDKYKISIENIAPSPTDTSQFGTFDVLIRSYNDTDAQKVVLETWRNLSLDEESDRYIAKVIGDYNSYYNFDANEDKQSLIDDGEYVNNSKILRVEMSDEVKIGEFDPTSLPFGFRGSQHLVTSGSAVFAAHTDSGYLTAANPFKSIVQPPVPMRLSLAKGSQPTQTADRNLYWGVQFEQVISPVEPNSSTRFNKNLLSFNQYYPNFHTDFVSPVVRDNEGTPDTATNGILDADRFCNNQFSLEKVKVKYRDVAGQPANTNALKDWTYVRAGNVATDSGTLTRALTVSDLLDSTVRSVAKFSFFLEGGFNGSRIFNKDAYYLTNTAVLEEMNSTSRGLSSGPTVKSYLKAIDIVRDVTELEIQLLTIPGIRHSYITDTAISAMEDANVNAMYIMDVQERDNGNAVVTTAEQAISVKNTITDFNNRGLNSSFAAAYFPDVLMRDDVARTVVRVPPSVAVLGAFAKNDSLGYPWFAPAGFARGTLSTTNSIVVELNQQNASDLATANINPLISFVNNGPAVWGQKTVYARVSPFERVNVRRLMLTLRRQIRKIADRILFEPNRDETLEKFSKLIQPILKNAQTKKGLDFFSVQINTQTTTQADVENKIIRGKIYVVPTKTLEALSLDFVLTNQGTSVTG